MANKVETHESIARADAKAGDIVQFLDASNNVAETEVAEGTTAIRMLAKALPYMQDKAPFVLEEQSIISITRVHTYEIPDKPGLYLDANDGLFYLDADKVWWFVYEPARAWRTQDQMTKVDPADCDKSILPLRPAKAVLA